MIFPPRSVQNNVLNDTFAGEGTEGMTSKWQINVVRAQAILYFCFESFFLTSNCF